MSIDKTLAERAERYGDFSDHAKIAQDLQKVMHNSRRAPTVGGHPDDFKVSSWEILNDVQRQALTVIADKIARILSGDPNYADNWHDIQGYAKLVEDRLTPPAKNLFADEPAAEIDDESPRMQAIAQNGNDGEHYYSAFKPIVAIADVLSVEQAIFTASRFSSGEPVGFTVTAFNNFTVELTQINPVTP